MSKSMEDVLDAHHGYTDLDGYPSLCSCGRKTPQDEETHNTHLAAMLKEAGFGSQHDAWAEGHDTGWIDADLASANGGSKKTASPYPATEGAS